MAELDSKDTELIALLRRDARMSLSDLAAAVGLSRVTVRNRIARLREAGTIVGFTVVLAEDVRESPVRGLMMLGIEGRGTDRLLRVLGGLSEVRALHTTNGKWDVIWRRWTRFWRGSGGWKGWRPARPACCWRPG